MTQRNEPCPCGSGRKFKKCCGARAQPTPAATARESEGEVIEERVGLFRSSVRPATSAQADIRRARHLSGRLRADDLQGTLFYRIDRTGAPSPTQRST